MSLEGTVVNGRVELDQPGHFPEGTRVRVEPADADAWDDLPPPPPAETYEEHLAILRQSIAEAEAGEGGIEAREFFKQLAIEHNLPLQPGE